MGNQEVNNINGCLLASDEYHTSADKHHNRWDRIIPGSRWYFIVRFLGQLFRNRSLALRGVYDTQTWARSSQAVLELIESCGGRFHITGLNNLRAHRDPVVFVGNHMSILETMVLPGIIAPVKEVTFVVKSSLVSHPLFGPVMRARAPIVVNRIDARADLIAVMTAGVKKLTQGISVVVFPQSSRKIEFNPADFNKMGVKLARAAGVPVIPVAVKTDFWETGRIVKDLGPIHRDRPIHMAFGEPFFILDSARDENRKIIDFITGCLVKWNGIVTNNR